MKGLYYVALLIAADPVWAQTAEESRALVLNPLRAIEMSSLSGFRDKPLFAPARAEPAEPPAAAVAVLPPPKIDAPPSPPPRLTLIGIIDSGHDVAIVHENDSAAAKLLESGDRLGSWVVTILPPRTLRLTNGARTVDYNLFAHDTAGLPQAKP